MAQWTVPAFAALGALTGTVLHSRQVQISVQ